MKRKSRFKNVKAEQMGLIQDPKKLENYHKKVFPAYTEAEKTVLRERYTPEQYEAIMAGEDAVDPRDLTIQGRLRDDPFRMEYLEDFATIQPVIDMKPKVQEAPQDVVFPSEKEWVDGFMDRLAERADTKMKDTIGKAVARALRRAKQDNPEMIDYSEEELVELEQNPELRRKIIVGGEAASNKMYAAVEARFAKDPASDKAITPAPWWDQIDKHFFEELSNEFGSDARNPLSATHTDIMKEMRGEPGKTYSALAPELGKVPGVEGMFKPPGDPAEDALDPSGQYKPIQLATGMALRDVLRIATKQVVMRRVAQQTRLGKIIRFHCMVVAGNGNGRLGIGEAKSVDPQIASVTASLLSLRNMKPIRRYENRTVYGQMEKRFSGTTVKLEARPPGMFPFPASFVISRVPLTSPNQASVSVSPTVSLRWRASPASTTWPPRSAARGTP